MTPATDLEGPVLSGRGQTHRAGEVAGASNPGQTAEGGRPGAEGGLRDRRGQLQFYRTESTLEADGGGYLSL